MVFYKEPCPECSLDNFNRVNSAEFSAYEISLFKRKREKIANILYGRERNCMFKNLIATRDASE
jgi:hypothetical protein